MLKSAVIIWPEIGRNEIGSCGKVTLQSCLTDFSVHLLGVHFHFSSTTGNM